MKQRSRILTAFGLLGLTGLLVTAGAVVFSVVRVHDLTAAEAQELVPAAREQPAADTSQLQPLQPLPSAEPARRVRPVVPAAVWAGGIRRVPDFSEMETKAEAALETRVTAALKDVGLKAALDSLSKSAGVPIQLSQGLLEYSDELTFDETQGISAEFSDTPLRQVLRDVFLQALELDQTDWQELRDSGQSIQIVPTPGGVEVGLSVIGTSASHSTRVYLLGMLASDEDSRKQIIQLLYDGAHCYWKYPTADGKTAIRWNGAVFSTNDDDDVLQMARFAGSITWINSIGGLVVTTDEASHHEIVQTLRLLDEALQVAGGLHSQKLAAEQSPTTNTSLVAR